MTVLTFMTFIVIIVLAGYSGHGDQGVNMSKIDSPQPTGTCWCDCGGATKPGAFFLQGHDKRAERYLVALGSGPIAKRLALAGYIPGKKSLRDATLKADPTYEECGRVGLDGEPCRIIGRGRGMAVHRDSADRHLS